jgi:UDP-3-O-[3-hydroxymyristoyl] N-acetylglucosamine deacetylase
MVLQRTIKNVVSSVGVGLHTGEKVTLTLNPAQEEHGIIFERTDIETRPRIRVNALAVKETNLCSTIGDDNFSIATVEHLMSALSATGIDNILIQLDGSEIPIMDGSSIPFIHLIKSAIIVEQKKAKEFVVITDVVEIVDGDKFARFEPHNGFIVDFTIDFPHPAFKEEESNVSIDFFKESYIDEISRARTFGFMQEVEFLRSNGLARGGSLENAIVLDDYKILNEEGLRYKDEFVRHKILDAIGDLYILGNPIIGKFTAYKSGHDLNNRLLRLLIEKKDAWEVKSISAPDLISNSNLSSYLHVNNELTKKGQNNIQ